MTTTSTASRSTARAGKLQAGDVLAEPVAAIVGGVGTTTNCDSVRPVLERRHEAAVQALEAHGAPDELAEDAEIDSHAAEAARLQREIDRCHAGLERLATRRAEIALADQQDAARAKLAAARKAAARAEDLAAKLIPTVAEDLRALFEELRTTTTTVVDAFDAAQAAGIGDEASDLQLPHEKRYEREIVEDREVVSKAPRVGVFDANGNPVGGGGGRHFGKPVDEPEPAPTRRIERVVIRPRHAPAAMHRVRVTVPTVDGGHLVVNPGEN